MASVRIQRTSAVTLPITNKAPLRLSAFDGMFVSSEVPLNFVYLFPSPTMAFPELAESVKHSLAQALQSFHPFAGELTYLSSSRTIAVVFPAKKDACCVTFIEAETDMGLKGLLDAEELDADALRQLVPDIRREVLPAPVMAVQVTQAVGGVVVGLALDHTVADGHGLFHFLNTWTAAATSSRNPKNPLPIHDRNLVRFDGDEEFNRAVLRHFTPDLPRVNTYSYILLMFSLCMMKSYFFPLSSRYLEKQYLSPHR